MVCMCPSHVLYASGTLPQLLQDAHDILVLDLICRDCRQRLLECLLQPDAFCDRLAARVVAHVADRIPVSTFRQLRDNARLCPHSIHPKPQPQSGSAAARAVRHCSWQVPYRLCAVVRQCGRTHVSSPWALTPSPTNAFQWLIRSARLGRCPRGLPPSRSAQRGRCCVTVRCAAVRADRAGRR